MDNLNDPRFRLSMFVLQPTTFCNLDCEYCYLPLRDVKRKMPGQVTENLADYIGEHILNKVPVIWHGENP